MKITKKLYDKMLKCCNLVAKASVMEKEIEAELETKGIDIDRLRNDDGLLVQFINYGEIIIKEDIEEDLNEFKEARE